jgi:hypothetical protein
MPYALCLKIKVRIELPCMPYALCLMPDAESRVCKRACCTRVLRALRESFAGASRVCKTECCTRVLRALRDLLTDLEFQGVFQPIYTLELLLDLELRLRYFVRFLLRRYYRLLLLVDYCRLLLLLVC